MVKQDMQTPRKVAADRSNKMNNLKAKTSAKKVSAPKGKTTSEKNPKKKVSKVSASQKTTKGKSPVVMTEVILTESELEALYADSAALLTSEEEIILATKIQAGQAVVGIRGKGHTALIRDGERARARFIEANLRLVQYVARKYIGRGVDFDDLVQEGTLGLMHAITKYDPKKGFRFSTYAMPWINQYITRAIGNGARTVRLPLYQVEALNKMRSVHAKILAESSVEPTIAELAKASGLEEERVSELIQATQSMVYLDAPVGENGERREIASPYFSSSVSDPSDLLVSKMRDEKIEAMLGTLGDNEATILRLRFGFSDSEPLSHEQISKKMDMPKDSVRKIEHEALSKLRHPSRSNGLSAIVF